MGCMRVGGLVRVEGLGMSKTPDFDAAAAFMAGQARVVDRRLFQRLFPGGASGSAAAVRDAVAAYRNCDGGFGFALEPDCRAPLPSSLARGLFSGATIDAHLDHLAGAQRDDGGWMFGWPSWSPAAEADWRGFLTVDALRILRANGRA
jgi:hypothetical protein